MTFNAKIANPGLSSRRGGLMPGGATMDRGTGGQGARGGAPTSVGSPVARTTAPCHWAAKPRTGRASAVTLAGHLQAPKTTRLTSVRSSASTGIVRPRAGLQVKASDPHP